MDQDPLHFECHLSSPTKILFLNKKISYPELVSLMRKEESQNEY